MRGSFLLVIKESDAPREDRFAVVDSKAAIGKSESLNFPAALGEPTTPALFGKPEIEFGQVRIYLGFDKRIEPWKALGFDFPHQGSE